jgi:chemotaxis protein MotB
MPTPPIIIIKKKGGHGGHHGGAWKVAYADFVTAMMALFIVLWLMNTSKPVQEAISGYFKDPSGTAKETGSSLKGSSKSGSSVAGAGENSKAIKEDMTQLKEQLQKRIQSIADLDKLKKNIEMTVTPEGLRIELLESAGGTFFDSGSPQLNKSGRELLALLAAELGKIPNHISVEGHTDAKPFAGNSSYSNWELSADRANAARRLMQQPSGLRGDQVSQMRGFADQRLRMVKDPLDPSNRRISIIVQYLGNSDEAQASGKDAPGAREKTLAASGKTESESAEKKDAK